MSATTKSLGVLTTGLLILIVSGHAVAADLSPQKWPVAERERAEKREAAGWTPAAARSIASKHGVISAIASPIAVQAGVEALRQVGSAADAAATTALTEIATQLGSVVSYAGILTLVYYDVRSDKVYSLDAGYNSYLGESEPMTIPQADLGPLNGAVQALEPRTPGRTHRPRTIARDAKHLSPGSWRASRRCTRASVDCLLPSSSSPPSGTPSAVWS